MSEEYLMHTFLDYRFRDLDIINPSLIKYGKLNNYPRALVYYLTAGTRISSVVLSDAYLNRS